MHRILALDEIAPAPGILPLRVVRAEPASGPDS